MSNENMGDGAAVVPDAVSRKDRSVANGNDKDRAGGGLQDRRAFHQTGVMRPEHRIGMPAELDDPLPEAANETDEKSLGRVQAVIDSL